jgi:hypothetical protein
MPTLSPTPLPGDRPSGTRNARLPDHRESEDRRRELEERLAARVLEEIVPCLAEGLLSDLRRRDGTQVDSSPEALDTVFQATRTFLYRLLFLFHAEPHGSLPVGQTRGYHPVSLTRLKREIAEVGGKIAEEAGKRIARRYREDEYELHAGLEQSFRVIECGAAARCVSPLCGALFGSAPPPAGDSPAAQTARCLAAARIPDRYLARALDLLARDEDPGSRELAFIDYASLGVRRLGSLHEALLECTLRIAPEREIARGRVHLEHDPSERKATGSYYTPDRIVKYIVEEALGPMLEARLAALRPRLSQALADHRACLRRQAELRGRGITPVPAGHAERIGQELVRELLDFRVLDPAMGTGHFLVEALSFITDRLLAFLAGFPWNPVHAELARTRAAILREMDEQGIAIDATYLTDGHLLKRYVLKRCIYGVDLSPTAVELAKISLWLECLIPGVPLCFLDHHLRCGNSLIGITATEVQEALDGRQGEPSGSLPAGVFLGAECIRQVSEIPDLTHEQLRHSRAGYRRASDALLAGKRLLDLHTSRCFGGQGQPSATGASGVAAPGVAREKRFFHWDLEFPEVFFGTRPTAGCTLEWRERAGFHAVIGNPPYLNVKRGIEPAEKRFLEQRYALATGQWDQGALFYELALGSTALRGIAARASCVGLIVPKPFFLSASYLGLRELLLGAGEVVYCPCGGCFADAGVEASIGIVRKARAATLRIVDGRAGAGFSGLADLPAVLVAKLPFKVFTYLLPEAALDSLYSLPRARHLVPLGTVVRWTRGVEAGKRDAAVLRQPVAGGVPLILGEAVRPFEALPTAWLRVDPVAMQKFKPAALYALRPKLLLRRVAATLIAAVDETRAYLLNTLYVGRPRQAADAYALAALLNSAITRGLFRGIFNLDDTLFPYLRISQLAQLPIPVAALTDPELSELGRALSATAAEAARQELVARLDQRVGRLYDLPSGLVESLRRLGGHQAQVAAVT